MRLKKLSAAHHGGRDEKGVKHEISGRTTDGWLMSAIGAKAADRRTLLAVVAIDLSLIHI